MDTLEENEIMAQLLDTNNSIEIVVEMKWGKSLQHFPPFTINEIEMHRNESGKGKSGPILKTLERGRKFKEERYISADSIFTALHENSFFVKASCKASMKKEIRDINITLHKTDSHVMDARCTCPAGLSGYCNHVMALLFELADYSLNQLQQVPEEISCTSKLRQWGIPGQKNTSKEPVMNCSIVKTYGKRGISCTLYDPRKNTSRQDLGSRVLTLSTNLKKIDARVGFAHCIDFTRTSAVSTKFGEFVIGSPLSYQLKPVDYNVTYVTNIPSMTHPSYSSHSFVNLPLKFHSETHEAYPADWVLNGEEIEFLRTLHINNNMAVSIEQETVLQSKCPQWSEYRKNRITSSIAHQIYTRKTNHSTLVTALINPKPVSEKYKSVRVAMDHGKFNEPIARGKYGEILKYDLKRDVEIRETGFVIQPNLFWVGASPDGLISDKSENAGIGLIEIKCPKSKVKCSPEELLSNKTFYMKLDNGKPVLKKWHKYYTQIQMAMGVSGAQFCDFVVYTLKGLIISRIAYEHEYFVSLMKKINMFYRMHMMPELMKSGGTLDNIITE